MAINPENERMAIENLRQVRDELRNEIIHKGNKLRAVEEALKALDGDQPVQQSLRLSPTPKYSSIAGNTEAVLEFLKDNPEKEFKASELAASLKNLGFNTKVKQFPSTITNVLNRLCERGFAEKRLVAFPPGKRNQKREGTFYYRLKTGSGNKEG